MLLYTDLVFALFLVVLEAVYIPHMHFRSLYAFICLVTSHLVLSTGAVANYVCIFRGEVLFNCLLVVNAETCVCSSAFVV